MVKEATIMLSSHKINNQLAIKCLTFVAFLIATTTVTQTEGKRLTLLPLSAPEVYHILDESRNLDVIPDGKTVTNALAAGAGFAAGLAESLAGVFLLQVLTANVTDLEESLGITTTTAAPATKYYAAREICFGTRSARSVKDSTELDVAAEAYKRLHYDYATKLYSENVRKSKQRRSRRPLRNRNLRKHTSADYRRRRRQRRPHQNSKLDMARFMTVTYPTTTFEARTDDGTGTGTAAIVDNATPVTCVVVEKPNE
ncbi:uncharacterized protein [Musca autumnalis]|uniref:uncharacterized protein n=1 Tax=Musca autumnalis TaxID=221902 RepID=UPI003CF9B59E